MIFNSRVFAEVLEGRQEDVETVFKRIQSDDRHENIQLLNVEVIEKRMFAYWSIGFLGKAREDRLLLDHFGGMEAFRGSHLENCHLLRLLRDIVTDEVSGAVVFPGDAAVPFQAAENSIKLPRI